MDENGTVGASYLDKPREVWWRQWLWQVHLWTGLVGGLFVAVISLTGALIVFRVEFNRWTTPGTAYVQPQGASGARLSLDRMMATLRQAYPQDRLVNVFFEGGPELAWNFRSVDAAGHRVHTYIDPYTARITGRDDYSTKWTQWLFDLHADLLLGATGRRWNGAIAVALGVLAASGLVVWWPGRRAWRRGFRYERRARWKRKNYDLHQLVGFGMSAWLLLLAFTGAYFAFPELYREAVGATAVFTVPTARTQHVEVEWESFVRRAEAALPGIRAVSVAFPQKAGEPVTVRLKEVEDWHRIGQSYVYFEPRGEMIRAERWREQAWGLSLIRFMSPLHFGRFGEGFGLGQGVVWAVLGLYVLVGLAPVVLLGTGVLMYWNRDLGKRWGKGRK